jgi:hypothetical protein
MASLFSPFSPCANRERPLFLRQQNFRFARWPNGKRIKENRLDFRFPLGFFVKRQHICIYLGLAPLRILTVCIIGQIFSVLYFLYYFMSVLIWTYIHTYVCTQICIYFVKRQKFPNILSSFLHVHVSMSSSPCLRVTMSPCFRNSANGKRKRHTLFDANGNGKRMFVFLGRKTINGKQQLLFQQRCSPLSISNNVPDSPWNRFL